MMLIAIAQTLVGLAIAGLMSLIVLRILGYRIEFKLMAIKGRRRRHYEPDEHSQFF